EDEVRRRRPHELRADLAHLEEVLGLERGAVDHDELRDREAFILDRLPLVASVSIDALAEVKRERVELAVLDVGLDALRERRLAADAAGEAGGIHHVLANLVAAEVGLLELADERLHAVQRGSALNR